MDRPCSCRPLVPMVLRGNAYNWMGTTEDTESTELLLSVTSVLSAV
ncbi:hypothetical protein [Desulfatibacillum aliphaticivorans]|nr:hypothetical protein [Desulfatibacillum aliphaticivorans]